MTDGINKYEAAVEEAELQINRGTKALESHIESMIVADGMCIAEGISGAVDDDIDEVVRVTKMVMRDRLTDMICINRSGWAGGYTPKNLIEQSHHLTAMDMLQRMNRGGDKLTDAIEKGAHKARERVTA